MSFHNFYASWFERLNNLVDQLAHAPKPPAAGPPSPGDGDEEEDAATLLLHRELVNKVISHYGEYYREKEAEAERDAVAVVTAPWASSLERSLHWVAGWRPTTVFHLIYTETGARFESNMSEFLRGVRTGDLGDLSPAQMQRVSELQCETVRKENEIGDELAAWQEGAVELLQGDGDGDGMGVLEEKIRRLAGVVVRADELRMRTIWRVAEMLTPQQAVEFLIAAAQLQCGVRVLGLNQDDDDNNNNNNNNNNTHHPQPNNV